MTQEQFIELSGKIADYMLSQTYSGNPCQIEENGDEIYKEDAQEIFCEYCDAIQNIMYSVIEIEYKDRD